MLKSLYMFSPPQHWTTAKYFLMELHPKLQYIQNSAAQSFNPSTVSAFQSASPELSRDGLQHHNRTSMEASSISICLLQSHMSLHIE